jgi:hypothetical protein
MFFGSILRVGGIPHLLQLTPHGWALQASSVPEGLPASLAVTRWRTLEDARDAIVLARADARVVGPVGEA